MQQPNKYNSTSLSGRAIGGNIKKLRRKQAMTQAQLADLLGISASYLNLIEHNRRKVTVDILFKLSKVFQINLSDLASDENHFLVSDLMAILGNDIFEQLDITNMDVQDMVNEMPTMARAMLLLHDNLARTRRDLHDLSEKNNPNIDMNIHVGKAVPEIISDFIQEKQNYFPELEEEARRIRRHVDDFGATFGQNLENFLKEKLSLTIRYASEDDDPYMLRRYDEKRRELKLSNIMELPSRRFAMAYQIGIMSVRPVINMILKEAGITDDGAKELGRYVLVNYFAAALIMPYDDFLSTAKQYRYDIELLQLHHKVSFEQACHRLTTLNHPDKEKRGIPLHFIKVDMAGNITKRFSLSGLPIPRYGGTCARWNIFSSFSRPGAINAQISKLQDGSTYLCIASAMRKGGRGFGAHQSFMAIGIGCDVSYADQTVYSDGYDLQNLKSLREIGVTCRVCERLNCGERVHPPVHAGFKINEYRRGISPYYPADKSGNQANKYW